MTFRERIQKLCRDAGILQEEFAGRLDVSQQTASRWKTTADIRRRKSWCGSQRCLR